MMELDGCPVTTGQLEGLALYNFGHFTSMRVDRGGVRGLALHLERLVHDCRRLFDVELDPETVRRLIRRVCGNSPVIVRVTVFAPELELGQPGRDVQPRVLITTRAAADHPLPPLRLQSVPYKRELPTVKHVGLFGTVLRRRAAQRAGYDDVLFLDGQSRVSEGATWNVGFFDGTRLVWPRSDCLQGVTMKLLEALRNPESTRADIDLEYAAQMPAAFVSNAAIGVRPISLIDNISYRDDPALRDLAERVLPPIASH